MNFRMIDHHPKEMGMSPLSSNVSSFYLDRIEELLPEKKLVTEKLFKNQEGKPGNISVV